MCAAAREPSPGARPKEVHTLGAAGSPSLDPTSKTWNFEAGEGVAITKVETTRVGSIDGSRTFSFFF